MLRDTQYYNLEWQNVLYDSDNFKETDIFSSFKNETKLMTEEKTDFTDFSKINCQTWNMIIF